jgi:hypothetical protein
MKRLIAKLGLGPAAEKVPETVEVGSFALHGANLAVAYFPSRSGETFTTFCESVRPVFFSDCSTWRAGAKPT